ncbi:MAG: YjcQ family protein [Eubacterium sp.]
MDNFKIIYKILKALEKAMDVDVFDKTLISSETLGISDERWARIMKMMVDEGYVKGIIEVKYNGATTPMIKLFNPSLTLKGLEYLEENSLMKKAADIAKGIVDMMA